MEPPVKKRSFEYSIPLSVAALPPALMAMTNSLSAPPLELEELELEELELELDELDELELDELDELEFEDELEEEELEPVFPVPLVPPHPLIRSAVENTRKSLFKPKMESALLPARLLQISMRSLQKVY